MMQKILFFTILFVSACKSSQTEFTERLNVWIGAPTQTLISDWGMPDQQSKVDDNTQIYTYILQSQSGPNNPYPEAFVYTAAPTPNMGDNIDLNPVYYCNISFIVQNGLISSYNFNGDNCLVDILPDD
ncbi:MAG: hypothetical protein J6T72_05400 [Alphaproteobacteria bacterium]|nr:hypothetical protein [Alphaproteobacteria bacterium]